MNTEQRIKWLKKQIGPHTIGGTINATRCGDKISLKDMADRLNVTPQQLKDIEQNKFIPSLTFINKVAKILGYDLATFYWIFEEQVKKSKKEILIAVHPKEATNLWQSFKNKVKVKVG